MLESLADRTYRHLFLAQVVALLGTGMATVALGIIFTIKMVAYVGIAPISGAFANRVNRRAMLVGLDVVRAGAALMVLTLLALVAATGALIALRLWPKDGPFVVDDAHPRWASQL